MKKKILIAADHSSYTKRMLAYLAVHEERLGPNHHYSVVHSLLAVPGHAADSIANLAAEGKLDLLVLGSRDHSDLVNLGLGSVATKVLAKCATPALPVR